MVAAGIACALAGVAYLPATAQDRPAVVVDLSVLDALDPSDATGRPSWTPPLPERRPIPPIRRRQTIVAEPEAPPAPVAAPPAASARSAGLPAVPLPAVPLPAVPQAVPVTMNVSNAPFLWRRPIPVTASTFQVLPVGARPTMAIPSPSDKLIDANVEVETTSDMISALPIGDGFRMMFPGDRTALSETAEQLLDIVVDRMGEQPGLRLRVLAYAGGSPETAPRSRLLSLERALAVQDYLSDRGVRVSRIDLRAMGNSYVDGPPERVDLLLTE